MARLEVREDEQPGHRGDGTGVLGCLRPFLRGTLHFDFAIDFRPDAAKLWVSAQSLLGKRKGLKT